MQEQEVIKSLQSDLRFNESSIKKESNVSEINDLYQYFSAFSFLIILPYIDEQLI